MLIVGARCDRCGREISWPDHANKGTLIRWLRNSGWNVGNGKRDYYEERTLCPNCRKYHKNGGRRKENGHKNF